MSITLIKCTTHEVVQTLPLSDNQYACVRCGLRGSREDLFSDDNPCDPHFVTGTSGWQGEWVELDIP